MRKNIDTPMNSEMRTNDVAVDDITAEYDNPLLKKRPAARTYRARSDANIKSIKNSIEEVFGLPTGSVALCDKDGRKIRSDASIATLRKYWGEE